MSLCLMFDSGRRLVRRNLAMQIFSRYQERTRPLSELLQERRETLKPLSSLDVIGGIYARQGWRAQRRDPVPVQPNEPSLVAPHSPYCTLYDLMGVAVAEFERVVAEFAPRFTLDNIMVRLCHEFGDTPLDLAFPLARSVADALVQRPAERVIPVFTLPLVLSLMPDFYQRACNTLQACECLRFNLVRVAPFERYHKWQLQSQLLLMDNNRHHLAFVQQQALHYNQVPLARRDAERALYEADLVALTRAQIEEARADETERREIRRLARRLTRGDEPRDCPRKRRL